MPVLDAGGDQVGLFIAIVVSAVGNVEPPLFHVVDEAVWPTLEQKVSKLALSFSSTLAVKVASAIDISPFVSGL